MSKCGRAIRNAFDVLNRIMMPIESVGVVLQPIKGIYKINYADKPEKDFIWQPGHESSYTETLVKFAE